MAIKLLAKTDVAIVVFLLTARPSMRGVVTGGATGCHCVKGHQPLY